MNKRNKKMFTAIYWALFVQKKIMFPVPQICKLLSLPPSQFLSLSLSLHPPPQAGTYILATKNEAKTLHLDSPYRLRHAECRTLKSPD
jgi:hypothetical protein